MCHGTVRHTGGLPASIKGLFPRCARGGRHRVRLARTTRSCCRYDVLFDLGPFFHAQRLVVMESQYDVFISYSRRDAAMAELIVEALRAEGLSVFYDAMMIAPGADFKSALADAIGNARVIVALVTEASIGSKFIQLELMAAQSANAPIIPIAIDRLPENIPITLATIQFGILRKGATLELDLAQLVASVRRWLDAEDRSHPLSVEQAKQAGAAIAEEIRSSRASEDERSVFVVHGHDADGLTEVEDFLKANEVEAVVLTRLAGDDQSLFQRFMRFGTKANFAIVVMSADDFGASRMQYEADGVGERALQFRARQNVILELGFFYGRLGWENVFVLYKAPDRVFPNFERPSDLDGVVFHSMTNGSAWQEPLTERLTTARII